MTRIQILSGLVISVAVCYLIITNDSWLGRPTTDDIVRTQEDKRQLIQNIPPVLMKVLPKKPPNFLKEYKNPCWMSGGKLHCMPYFHQIGTTKCGTSDLCSRLRMHPDVINVTRKETHWISRGVFNGNRKMSPVTKYTSWFDVALPEIQRSTRKTGYHYKITADCSPSSTWENMYWALTPSEARKPDYEPVFTNADLIYFLNPNTKIIAIIRDPVERLYSNYIVNKGPNATLNGFDEYAKANVANFEACLKRSKLRGCVYTPKRNGNVRRLNYRLRLGIYHIHISDYLRVFPRDQVMVVMLEDYSLRTAFYLEKIYSFLGLDPLTEAEIQAIAKRDNQNVRKDGLGDMMNSTRDFLIKFYRPYNEKLKEMLGNEYDYNKKYYI